MYGFVDVWVLCVGVGMCICRFCNVWEGVCVDFTMRGCVYVGFCNVWVCVCWVL